MARKGAAGGSVHADRVFLVQRALTQLPGQVHGPGEIAEFTGLDDSTVHRILQSGSHDGTFVREGRGLYRLGAGAAQLGLKAVAHAPNKRVTHGLLEELRANTDGGLVFLYAVAPFGGARKQCLDMSAGDSDLSELGLTHRAMIAFSSSLRIGASGRVILAFLPEVIRERVLAEPIPYEGGPGAYHDDAELIGSLEQVRRRGFALDQEESAAGWLGCAAPVVWDGLIMGSVLVLKPKSLQVRRSAEAMVVAVRVAAGAFSQSGYGAWSAETPSSY
jgi:DNA-binding IclR family transcriptional regulator